MGTYVTGDPASLRHAAAQLRQRVDVFRDVAGQVDATTASAVVVGPAGDRFRSSISSTSAGLRGTCDRITDVAARLVREADRIEMELAQQASLPY